MYFFLEDVCDIVFGLFDTKIIKKWSMLSVPLSSYGCTREVGRARKKHLSGTRPFLLVI